MNSPEGRAVNLNIIKVVVQQAFHECKSFRKHQSFIHIPRASLDTFDTKPRPYPMAGIGNQDERGGKGKGKGSDSCSTKDGRQQRQDQLPSEPKTQLQSKSSWKCGGSRCQISNFRSEVLNKQEMSGNAERHTGAIELTSAASRAGGQSSMQNQAEARKTQPKDTRSGRHRSSLSELVQDPGAHPQTGRDFLHKIESGIFEDQTQWRLQRLKQVDLARFLKRPFLPP